MPIQFYGYRIFPYLTSVEIGNFSCVSLATRAIVQYVATLLQEDLNLEGKRVSSVLDGSTFAFLRNNWKNRAGTGLIRRELVTMAGIPICLYGVTGQTYGRHYQAFGNSDIQRKQLSRVAGECSKAIDGEAYISFGNLCQEIGDEYNQRPFNTSSITGGCFVTIRTYKDGRLARNCFQYALSQFGEDLEKLTEKNLSEILNSVKINIDPSDGIDCIVKKCFTSVNKPENGDLVLYRISAGNSVFTPWGEKVKGTTHAGIFKDSAPTWNSLLGGIVESKWGEYRNPHVFRHDTFYVPDFYGDEVTFHRIKKVSD